MVLYVCSLSTWEAEAGGSEFRANQGNTKPYLLTKTQQEVKEWKGSWVQEGEAWRESWVLEQERGMERVIDRGARGVLDICKCIYF